MFRYWRVTFISFLIFCGILGALYAQFTNTEVVVTVGDYVISDEEDAREIPVVVAHSEPEVEIPSIPSKKILNNSYHIFQTFNNCGPASLSMALSYYGYNATQQELGQALRPYQVANGDNDDKSVTLEELAEKSKDYDLIPYHRPNGTVEIVKTLIANDMPVIARTWLKADEDIGHYRVIKGYDESRGIFIQDDSLQGKNLEYKYDDFFEIWKPFNFEYLVLVPEDKVELAEAILGANVNVESAWEASFKVWQDELENNPNDVNARFNLSIALYNLERYEESVEEFEKVESRLPMRALWYQIEPVKAYYELGDYDRVFEITDRILNNHNRAFSELYIIRGNIYKERGEISSARSEYEKAVTYNRNLEAAQEALDSI